MRHRSSGIGDCGGLWQHRRLSTHCDTGRHCVIIRRVPVRMAHSMPSQSWTRKGLSGSEGGVVLHFVQSKAGYGTAAAVVGKTRREGTVNANLDPEEDANNILIA